MLSLARVIILSGDSGVAICWRYVGVTDDAAAPVMANMRSLGDYTPINPRFGPSLGHNRDEQIMKSMVGAPESMIGMASSDKVAWIWFIVR